MAAGQNQGDVQIVEELADAFFDRDEARMVVERAGLPRRFLPDFRNPLQFWYEVVDKAEQGALDDGLWAVVQQAALYHPHNEAFAAYLKQTSDVDTSFDNQQDTGDDPFDGQTRSSRATPRVSDAALPSKWVLRSGARPPSEPTVRADTETATTSQLIRAEPLSRPQPEDTQPPLKTRGSQPQVKAQPNSPFQLQPQATTEPKATAEPQALPESKAASEPQALPKSKATAESQVPPEPEDAAESQAPPESEVVAEAQVPPEPETVAESQVPPEPETVAESQAPPESETPAESELVSSERPSPHLDPEPRPPLPQKSPETTRADIMAAIEYGTAAFVVGAGVSFNASGRDEFTLWNPVLQRGVEMLKDPSPFPEVATWAPERFFGRAEELYELLDSQGLLERLMQETLGRVHARFTDVIKALHATQVPLLTVNHDTLLEAGAERSAVDWSSDALGSALDEDSNQHVIHLHGCWSSTAALVPNKDIKYSQLWDAYPSRLREWLEQRTLILVGLDRGLHLAPLKRLLTEGKGPHYLLTREQDAEEAKNSLPPGAQVYVVSCGRSYDSLSSFIHGLKSQDGSKRLGRGVNMRREARPEQLKLDVDKVGRAIADVLATSKGELCLALYGPWGRGKTTLAQEICKNLTDAKQRPIYQDVWFNAWKYRSPAEIWSHLYERMVHGASMDGGLANLARVLRANVSRSGLMPIGVALLLLALGLVPLTYKVGTAVKLVGFFSVGLGIIGTIWLSLAVRRTAGVMKHVWALYGTLPSHQHRLGLQATIGKDLHHLLRGWISKPYRGSTPTKSLRERLRWGRRRKDSVPSEPPVEVETPPSGSRAPYWYERLLVIVGVFTVSAVFAFVLWGAVQTETDVVEKDAVATVAAAATPNETIANSAADVRENATAKFEKLSKPLPSAAWWIVPPVVWLALWCAIVGFVVRAGRKTDRILLVVDDLDRCPPQLMLDILESIKLMVEEEEFHSRLQVLVLVDDEMLVRAVTDRFLPYLDRIADPQKRQTLQYRLVREHLDKIFLGDLRLGVLTGLDVEDLVKGFVPVKSDGENDGQGTGNKTGTGRNTETLAPNKTIEITERERMRASPVSANVTPTNQRGAASLPGGEIAQGPTQTLPPGEARATDSSVAAESNVSTRAQRGALRGEQPPKALELEDRDAPRFTDGEQKILTKTCQELLSGHAGHRLGPRAIKSIILRYQLARRLLEEFEFPIDPVFIAERITRMPHRETTPWLDPTQSSTDQAGALIEQVVGIRLAPVSEIADEPST